MWAPERYSLNNIKRALKHPRQSAYWELRNWHRKFVTGFCSERNSFLNSNKTDIMGRDWDNLIILDACRYDAFEEINDLSGELEALELASSNSSEFVDEYFLRRDHYDTVLVTGNPHSPTPSDGVFHDVRFVDVRDVDGEQYPGPPVDDASVVPPEDIVSATINAHEEDPQKRIISHFMQPHLPFLGERGRELYSKTMSGSTGHRDGVYKGGKSWVALDIYRAVLDDEFDISSDDIWAAYLENLRIVLDYVDGLVQELDGKTVITADHGELLGDRILGLPYFGHPPKIRTPKLNTVPWFTIESETRREVTEDPPGSLETRDDDAREAQLEALGYK